MAPFPHASWAAEAVRLTRAYARLLTPDHATPESIARAKAQTDHERRAITAQTGIAIADDGTVTIHPR